MVYPKNNRIDHCYIHDFTKEDRWIQKDPGSKSEDYIWYKITDKGPIEYE